MTFLTEPRTTPDVQALHDADVAEQGYVMNLTRAWGHRPELKTGLYALISAAGRDLDVRTRGILITACVSARGDSYCSLAWGERLAARAGADTAAGVLRGTDDGLTDRERALATWARAVARDPNGTTAADVQALRDAGLDEGEILAVTVFVALRLALATVNDALGAEPDAQLRDSVPPAVQDAVTFGRPIASA